MNYYEESDNARKQLPDGSVTVKVDSFDGGNQLAIEIRYGNRGCDISVHLPVPIDAEHIAYGIASKGWDECLRSGFMVEE